MKKFRETDALSFYRSRNVLGWSKSFVPDQKFIYLLWQSQKFWARQKDDLHSIKLFLCRHKTFWNLYKEKPIIKKKCICFSILRAWLSHVFPNFKLSLFCFLTRQKFLIKIKIDKLSFLTTCNLLKNNKKICGFTIRENI